MGFFSFLSPAKKTWSFMREGKYNVHLSLFLTIFRKEPHRNAEKEAERKEQQLDPERERDVSYDDPPCVPRDVVSRTQL